MQQQIVEITNNNEINDEDEKKIRNIMEIINRSYDESKELYLRYDKDQYRVLNSIF